MTHYRPNKETIRRICSIFKCDTCFFLNNDGTKPCVWIKLDTALLPSFKEELESWSGCPFQVYNFDSPIDVVSIIQTQGEQLLPIDQNIAMQDLHMRRKHNYRSRS